MNHSFVGMGSGCGPVGRAVASDTRGPKFESSDQQNSYWTFIYCQLYWKDENKAKRRPGIAHFLKKCWKQWTGE